MKRARRRPAFGTRLGRGQYCVGTRAASRLAGAHAMDALAAGVLATAIALASAPTIAEPAPNRLAAAPAAQPEPSRSAAKQKSGPTAKPAAGAAKLGAPKAAGAATAPLTGTVVPKPAAGNADEPALKAALDAALAPLRATGLPDADAAAVRDAVAAVSARNLQKAQDHAAQISSPLGRKIVDWYRLRSGYGEPQAYRAFLAANPAWPDRGLLTQRMEEALFTQGGDAAAIRSSFDASGPKTGAGLAALASALLAAGDSKAAAPLAARAWRETMIPASLEEPFLQRFKPLLTEADHKWRLDTLLMDDIRWTGARNEKAAFVRRLLPLLSEAERRKGEARLAVYLRSSEARRLMDALPADARPDWGLALSRIQLLRRTKQYGAAAKLLLSAPTDTASIVSPDDWWEERRANAYEALAAGNPKLAYELVRDAGALTVNPAKEQSFMAGWLALRKLADPAKAEPHFAAMRKSADGPLSRAKAEYWLGRLAETRGQRDKATDHYRRASAETDTFHGQLAALKIDPSRRSLPIRSPAAPSSDEVARFVGLDAAQAAVAARKAGLDPAITRAFLNGLRNVTESEGEVALLVQLAETLGDTQAAVRIAKSAVARGQNLIPFAYPVHPFPAYTALRQPPEAALLLAIARQESEFNTRTLSGAGARGLLQVMPITARHVCRDYKITCDIPRLMTDMSYNTSLASAYIADRMDEFLGSYVLSIAGYNAGPGRARQWIREFGDPREQGVDVVDWIERIPFQETREYVAKVLSNVQIYRARLGDGSNALRLAEDFARARGAARAAPAPVPSSAGAGSGGGATTPQPRTVSE